MQNLHLRCYTFRMGRPTDYTEDAARKLLTRMERGETIIRICADNDMPELQTLFDWTVRDTLMLDGASFPSHYARARLNQAHFFATEIIDLSDTPRIGERIEIKTEGEAEVSTVIGAELVGKEVGLKTADGRLNVTITEDMIGQQATLFIGVPEVTRKVVTADMVERTKLQIDARKWFASRVAPREYGDRVAMQALDEHGKPTRPGVNVLVMASPPE